MEDGTLESSKSCARGSNGECSHVAAESGLRRAAVRQGGVALDEKAGADVGGGQDQGRSLLAHHLA